MSGLNNGINLKSMFCKMYYMKEIYIKYLTHKIILIMKQKDINEKYIYYNNIKIIN